MSEEERKAIEDLKRTIEYYNKRFKENEKITSVIVDNFDVNNLFILLNLIENQQKGIEKLKNNNKDLLKKLRNRVKDIKRLKKYSLYKKEFSRLNKQIEKNDKIIDEMAGYLAIIRDCPNEDKGANIDCENRCSTDDDIYAKCWKMYFERKAENE